MEKSYEECEEILKKYGATNIKFYVLISNYGYGFDLDGKHYDIRYWANCYGVALNRFEISCPKKDRTEKIDLIEKEFNS